MRAIPHAQASMNVQSAMLVVITPAPTMMEASHAAATQGMPAAAHAQISMSVQ